MKVETLQEGKKKNKMAPPLSPKSKRSLEASFNKKIQLSMELHQFVFGSFKGAIKQTTIEYTHASSLHGVQYIFEGGRRLKASRVAILKDLAGPHTRKVG